MKKLEFETAKGQFVLIDAEDITTSWYYFMYRNLKPEYNIKHEFKLGTNIFKLSEITEKEAHNIVEETYLGEYTGEFTAVGEVTFIY